MPERIVKTIAMTGEASDDITVMLSDGFIHQGQFKDYKG
jgi:hypothetical protein